MGMAPKIQVGFQVRSLLFSSYFNQNYLTPLCEILQYQISEKS
jgi:hypothetical protein